jgi:hypothetical protein
LGRLDINWRGWPKTNYYKNDALHHLNVLVKRLVPVPTGTTPLATTTMVVPKVECNLLGRCSKNKKCYGGCGKCKNHCACTATNTVDASTPRKFDRHGRDATLEKIRLVVDTELNSPDKVVHIVVDEEKKLKGALDFEQIRELLPFSAALQQLPRSITSKIICAQIKYFRCFISLLVDLIVTICKSVVVKSSPTHSDPFVREVEEALIQRFQVELGLDEKDAISNMKHKEFICKQIELYEKTPTTSSVHRFIRGSLCNTYSNKQLEKICERKVPWGSCARKKGKKDYRFFQEFGAYPNEMEDAHLCLDGILPSDQHDDAIRHAVAFIVHNCNLFAHGQKSVPLGDGSVMSLPVLTRQKTTQDMWDEYKSSFDVDLKRFTKILAHDGPLNSKTSSPTNSRSGSYKGSIYNLLLEWTSGATTWEPMHAVVASDPLTVASYGRANNLLDIKGWVHLKRYLVLLEKEKPKMEAFQGGKTFLGETSFKLLVRVLTSGDERLVKSVDYVKGILIHDNIMTLQRIISDLLGGSVTQQKKLTENLTILGNYLKVQYKKHASMPNSAQCDVHGLLHGLTSATNPQQMKPHYSNMGLVELKELVNGRKLLGIRGAKNVSKLARALDFDDWVGQDSSTDTMDWDFPKDQASFDALILGLERLKRAELEAVAEHRGILLAKSFRSKADYLNALKMALDDKFTNQLGTLVTVFMKFIKCWHLTHSFLSHFMFI